MKIALIDGKRTKVNIKKRETVNYRNFYILSKYLNADLLLDYTNIIKHKDIIYDCIIVGFSSLSTEINYSKHIIQNSKKIICLYGEYGQQPNPALYYSEQEYRTDAIINGDFEKINSIKRLGGSVYKLNFNLLISRLANELINKKYDCIYYGRWRFDRVKYFKKYLKNDIYLSTSNKNFKKYKHVGCSPKWISKLSWEEKKETLNLFRYSLYIEDEYTHKVFNNLANRWYEAGFCNVVMFFDVNCWNTINKSEIARFKEQIKDYIVKDYDELKIKIDYCNKNFEKHLAIQKSWRLQEPYLRKKMLEDLREIIYN